ncbi:MAG TPA: hypothetical protein VK968_00690 [Roseimicrobium sp.]|nr:hypothetical protein [Roseimicrobium sp.]
MSEDLKSSGLHSERITSPVSKATDYSAEVLLRFRDSFRPVADAYRRFDRRATIITFILFGLFIVGIEALPKTVINWVCGPLVVALVIWSCWAASRRPLLECPACHNLIDSRTLGSFCPECGSDHLDRGNWLLPAKCGACDKRIFRGRRGGRRYTIRACTHCGVQLDQKGV